MRAYVFTDPTLTRHAGRFVWLEIDTEKARNAALGRRLGVSVLPTFFVVDPADGRVALRWVGGFTVAQLDRLLDDGAVAVSGRAGPGAADAALLEADRLYAAADYPGAVRGYERALAAAPGGWPPYPRAVDALLFALSSADSNEAVARLARDAFPRLSRAPSAPNLAGSGLDAAVALPDTLAGRADLIRALEADARAVLADSALRIAADDRSGVYIALLDARHDAGDTEGARRVAAAWAAFLEGEAARARTAEQRAVFDSHRLSAYLELGEPGRAIPMLEASERDLPGDYNPPARLAVAYRALKRWDAALAASDRALARAYGPRRLGILTTRADIFSDRGEPAAARRTLEGALSEAEALPQGQRSEGTIAGLRRKLAALP
jgi:tetratricopeptide (TPR) repeat protein